MGLFDKLFQKNQDDAKKTSKSNKTKEQVKAKVQGKTKPASGGKTNSKSSGKSSTQVPGQGRRGPSSSSSSINLERELATPHLVPSSPVTNVFNKTYDCVAFLIHCPVHMKIAVAKSPTDAIWLPYVQKPDKMAWYAAAREGVKQVLAEGNTTKFDAFSRNLPFDQMLLLEVARVQMPSTNKFVTRFTFYVRLKPSSGGSKPTESSVADGKKPGTPRSRQFECCVNTPRLLWMALDYISEGYIRNCWGPELVDLGRQVVQASKAAMSSQDGSSSTQAPLIFHQKLQEQSVDQLFEILPHRDGTMESSGYLESLKQIKTSKNDIERLFNDFLDHCYPSFFMTYDSFRHYLRRNGFENSDSRLKRFFRAFNRAGNGYLSFNELLMGLISIERTTPHVEFRIKFVFDYYDSKSRGVLLEEDFAKMVRDMNTDKKGRLTCSDGQIKRMAADAMKCFRTKKVNNRLAVSFNAFLNGIGSHAFRHTSLLCRSKRNVFLTVSRRITARGLKTKVVKGRLADVITKKSYTGSCEPCKTRKYKVLGHVSIINLDGYCSDQMEALEVPLGMGDQQQQLPPESESVARMEDASELSLNFVTEPPRPDSVAAFMLLAKIRQYNEHKPRRALGQAITGLMCAPEERGELVELIKTIAEEIIPVMASEPRCKPVPSPSFIIGDIHGNLEDLISLERTIWRRFPEINGMHYLFLGDYVDRGRWSVECILYLLAMKLLRPASITLLRGNHEVRDIQIKYTYRRECLIKYGDQHGQEVWDITNRIFDHMPLCAVVDGNVFCAHGGIPHRVRTVDEINSSIPVDLVDPEHESEVAWEIMWSDPMVPESFREAFQMADPSKMANLRPGFIMNQKRGTAYFFNDVAASNFLADNQLSHIIRAHEVPKFGFIFHFDLKCTTIFSCSHYCGNDNECAVVLVDGSWMRVIRIDTASNVSATE